MDCHTSHHIIARAFGSYVSTIDALLSPSALYRLPAARLATAERAAAERRTACEGCFEGVHDAESGRTTRLR